MFDEKMKSERQLLKMRKSDFEEVLKKLRSIEEKWINNQMSHKTDVVPFRFTLLRVSKYLKLQILSCLSIVLGFESYRI